VEQYEAAIVDGAGRFRQVWHITLPALRSTIAIMLILRMGSVLDNGFDQIFLMSNAGNRLVSDVLETFTYREGIINGFFSYTTAIGLFKSVIGMILILGSNKLAKIAGESGIF
jgi:putative aldouronate transport system permease protein